MNSRTARFLASLIMIASAFGLAVQQRASAELTGSDAAAIWAMLRYFTVLTNIAVVVVMGVIAAGMLSLRSSFLIGGTTISIVLVGIVYLTLLRGLVELSGGARLADTFLHTVAPLATFLFWIAVVPKGGLRWRDSLLWMLYPLAYLIYALARGQVDGKYPYPFLDLSQIGWTAALMNCAGIALAFVVGGLLLVGIDRALGQRGSSR